VKKLIFVAGARPNFMKIAPLIRELKVRGVNSFRLVHTGQHYDEGMSGVFFKELGIPVPDTSLNVGSGSQAEQTSRVMARVEPVLEAESPDWVVVVGDVNSTMATAITAKKLGLRVAHVEAGLRSGDMSMPEEINRIVTDSISDRFFVTEQSGVDNLKREGHCEDHIEFVGHVMIDNLFYEREKVISSSEPNPVRKELGLVGKPYAVLTLHRPSNVDDAVVLGGLMKGIERIAERIPVVFPVHPRTRSRLNLFGLSLSKNVHCVEPLGYRTFLGLWMEAKFVLTDSGGLQEETSGLGVRCFTLRDNTERPITVSAGTNTLVGNTGEQVSQLVLSTVDEPGKQYQVPEKWDGKASQRIIDSLLQQRNP